MVVGLEPDRCPKFVDGFLQLASTLESIGEREMGAGLIRLEPDRATELGDRLVELTQAREHRTEVHNRPGRV